MILKVDVVATKVEEQYLIAPTTIGLATPVTIAINYMTNLLELLIWPNLMEMSAY